MALFPAKPGWCNAPMNETPFPFPQHFKFGCATASYQVEGAANEDGRGPSIWDTFCREPGRVLSDHTGDVAVDQYHRYAEDIERMGWLGISMYRFSISWSRVLPAGRGAVNEAGLDYYDRLVDALLAAGIEPWATLFHWDLPQALEDDFGGWESAETPRYFAEYAGLIARRLSDRVTNFFTVNELFCFTDKGYAEGRAFDAFAPGKGLAAAGRNQVRHHGLLAHGLAVQALREHARQPVRIGLAENPDHCCPIMETPPHIDAARTAYRERNERFLTAIMEGAYPESYLTAEGADAPKFSDEEMKVIGSPLDFVGLNMYAPVLIRAADSASGYAVVPFSESHPRLTMPWLHFGPQISYWAPRFMKELWGVESVYITENGCAALDRPNLDGEILDTDRLTYLRAHLQSAQRAVAEGWPLHGYFAWSLLDNFEWAHGYERRFGLFYVTIGRWSGRRN